MVVSLLLVVLTEPDKSRAVTRPTLRRRDSLPVDRLVTGQPFLPSHISLVVTDVVDCHWFQSNQTRILIGGITPTKLPVYSITYVFTNTIHDKIF